MGVRFECPNGHKLHVKAELAGRRGICPECQVRFVVPAESGGRAAAIEAAPRAATSAPSPAALSPSPAPQINTAPAVPTPPAPPSPAPTPEPIATASPGEPPTAADEWYVRPATGGQFGPATTDVFRTWIDEGRVPEDAWVWRDGWPEWQPAATALAALASGAAESPPPGPTPPALPPTMSAAPDVPLATPGDARPSSDGGFESPAAVARRAKLVARRRRNKHITIVLAVLAAVLLTVLGIVLSRG